MGRQGHAAAGGQKPLATGLIPLVGRICKDTNRDRQRQQACRQAHPRPRAAPRRLAGPAAAPLLHASQGQQWKRRHQAPALPAQQGRTRQQSPLQRRLPPLPLLWEEHPSRHLLLLLPLPLALPPRPAATHRCKAGVQGSGSVLKAAELIRKSSRWRAQALRPTASAARQLGRRQQLHCAWRRGSQRAAKPSPTGATHQPSLAWTVDRAGRVATLVAYT